MSQEYIAYYNSRRVHSARGFASPMGVGPIGRICLALYREVKRLLLAPVC